MVTLLSNSQLAIVNATIHSKARILGLNISSKDLLTLQRQVSDTIKYKALYPKTNWDDDDEVSSLQAQVNVIADLQTTATELKYGTGILA